MRTVGFALGDEMGVRGTPGLEHVHELVGDPADDPPAASLEDEEHLRFGVDDAALECGQFVGEFIGDGS